MQNSLWTPLLPSLGGLCYCVGGSHRSDWGHVVSLIALWQESEDLVARPGFAINLLQI